MAKFAFCPWFWSKSCILLPVFLDQIAHKKSFTMFLDRKSVFLDDQSTDKVTKICIFAKGFDGFGEKFAFFSFSVF